MTNEERDRYERYRRDYSATDLAGMLVEIERECESRLKESVKWKRKWAHLVLGTAWSGADDASLAKRTLRRTP